ncbi:MAG: hypothetical protein OXC13_02740 [Caldilineaceae bacterium]|nr:hypothetical protein [Caldilineaceae bacterium]
MKRITTNDPETRSADVVAENLEYPKMLLPEAFSEGKVDFEVLKLLLGDAVDERNEKYGLNWPTSTKPGRSVLTFENLILERQALTEPMFIEPKQMETVRVNGSVGWIAGLVGQRSGRFHRAAIDSWIEEKTGATGAQTFWNSAKPSNAQGED